MKIHPNALEAKVAARNNLNKFINEHAPLIKEALRPFVGQKILLATGGLAAKVKKALPESFQNFDKGFYYDYSFSLSFYAKYKTCEHYPLRNNMGQCACYQEDSCFIADMDNGVLKSIDNSDYVRRTDYTAKEIQDAREELKKAEDAVSTANNKLYGFGKYDN